MNQHKRTKSITLLLAILFITAFAFLANAQQMLKDPSLTTINQPDSPWAPAETQQPGEPGIIKTTQGHDNKPGIQLKSIDGSYKPAAIQQKLILPSGLYELTVWAKGSGDLLLKIPGNEERTQPLNRTWGFYGFLFDWQGGDAAPLLAVFGDGTISEVGLQPATEDQKTAWTKQQEVLRQYGFATHSAQRVTPGGPTEAPPSEIKPLEAITRRVVFWDERIDTAGQSTHQERLVNWLTTNGFQELKSEALADWMRERIDKNDAYGSVVVFSMGFEPAQLVEDGGEKTLWLRYLKAGGRIVGACVIPLMYFEYPDARPLPAGVRGYDALGLQGGWNQPYWGRNLAMTLSSQGKAWGFENPGDSIIGFAVESISVPFGVYTVPETGRLGAGSWMKNVRPDMPWSGLVKLCHSFDGRNDSQLRDVWRAAHYVGKTVSIPEMPPAWSAPKESAVRVKLTASGIAGRTEFSRGEEVSGVVTVTAKPFPSQIRVELLQNDDKQIAKWERPTTLSNDGKVNVSFDFSTAPYTYGTYKLKITALADLKEVATDTQTIGIRYVPPMGFCWQPWAGSASNMYRRDMTFADIKSVGMEPHLGGPDVVAMDAILRQNMGFTLRTEPDLTGGKEYTWEKNPEFFRLDINRKPIPSAYAGGRPTLGISQPELRSNIERGMLNQVKAVANHPGFRPYILTNDDWQIYYGADFSPHVVQRFKEQTGLDAPTKMETPPFGVLSEDNPWVRWFEFILRDVDGAMNLAETKGAVAGRSDVRMGPIPGGMQIPLILMWEPSQYPPLNFGKNGFNLICFYYYNTYWQPVMTNTYWGDVARMANRDLPEWCMPDLFMTAGYQRNNLFHLLAGGMRGVSYFTYDSRNPGTWDEVKHLAPQVRRFSPVQGRLRPAEKKSIGLLLSFTTNCFDAGHDLILAYAYENLMQAHFDVEPVCEEEILTGAASNYKAILLYNVRWLRQSIFDALKKYAQSGGMVLLDNTIPFDIPGSTRVNIDIGMGKQQTKGVPPEGVHASVPGINDYGDPGRIAVIQEALSTYIKPSFDCSDIGLVANRFEVDSVPYTWFVNAHTGKEYMFCRARMGAGHPGASTPEKIAELIDWEKKEMSAGPFTATAAYSQLPGVPYDLVAGRPIPVRKTATAYTLDLSMERFGGSLVAFYPESITGVSLKAPSSARPLQEVVATITVRGKKNLIPGAVPVEILLTDPQGKESPLSGVRATTAGMFEFRWTPAVNDVPGRWTLKVKELASGKSASSRILLSNPGTSSFVVSFVRSVCNQFNSTNASYEAHYEQYEAHYKQKETTTMKYLVMAASVLAMMTMALADSGEPWTESVLNWGLQSHQAEEEKQPHAANLRFDRAFKRFGEGSLAFDMIRPELKAFHYTELRLTLPQTLDARSFDNLHLSYHVPAGMKLTRFYVNFATPDWKANVELPESIKPVTGSWQDITIPLTQFASQKPGWSWNNVGNLMVLFFWDAGPQQTGTIHLDGVYLERTGKGIGNHKAPPAILFLDNYYADKNIDPTHRKNIEAKGYNAVWDLLQNQTWATISKFNTVVLGILPEVDINKRTDWSNEFAGKLELLQRYVNEGGGLLISTTPGSTNAGTGANLLLEPMGLTFVNEQVTDPKGITVQQEMFPNMEFAYTDTVKKDPLTEGVSGLWYCTSVQFTGGGGGSFTSALKPGPDWNVLITGSPTAASHRYQGAFGIEEAPATFASSPPLCAARQFGKGRVAVLPMNMTHTWLSGYHPWWQALVMSKGAKDKSSGGERLLLNLYDWLAQPSLASGSVGGFLGTKPEPITGAKFVSAGDEGGVIDWKNLPPPEGSKHNYVGLIGIHSAFSNGQGTVAEWVAAAKSAGYNWIAFTELHTQMNTEKWDQLKKECKQASDEHFCALPGMELIDHAGNHSLVLAPIPWPDPKLENDRMDLPQSIGYAYGFPAQVQYRFHEGLLPWYRNQFHFAGVFTYRDGKLIDDGEKEFHELSARTFQVWPVAIHETFKPEDIAKERKVGYQTYYTFGPLNKMNDDFCFSMYKFFFNHDFVYASSGPLIHRFGIQNNGTSYFDIPLEWNDAWRSTEGADRWRAVINVSSPAGLKKVQLVDAGQLLREFQLQNDVSFIRNVDGHHDRQYNLGLEVVDTLGGRAIAAASGTTAGRHWYGNCTDNVNIMEGGTYGTSDKPPLGYECYFPRWGFWLWPDLYYQDRQPLNLPHDERLRFASTDCTIVDHLFTVTHDPKVLNVGGGRMMRPLITLRDFEARTRAIRFTAGIDSPEFVILEPQIKLKRDIIVTPGGFPNLRYLFVAHGKPMAKGDFAFATVATEDGRTLVETTPANLTWPSVSHKGTLPIGGYAGAFPNYTGVGAVFALNPDTQFAVEGNADARRIQIGKDVKPGTIFKAGTVLSTRVLYMEGKWRQAVGNAEIENTRKMLGLNGTPGYTVSPTVGKVADTKFTCTLKTEKGAFRGKFSQAPLPVDLPICVSGLHPRWDAGIWIVGTERVRHFGIFEGTGYTTLRLDKGPAEVFIGHPIICDSPDLVLSLIEADSKHFLLEIHNPTDKVIKTRVYKNAGFDLGPGLDRIVTVPAGQSVKLEIQ